MMRIDIDRWETSAWPSYDRERQEPSTTRILALRRSYDDGRSARLEWMWSPGCHGTVTLDLTDGDPLMAETATITRRDLATLERAWSAAIDALEDLRAGDVVLQWLAEVTHDPR